LTWLLTVPFITMVREMSAGSTRLRTAKSEVLVNSAVVPEFWKLMLVPVPVALSVGVQSMTVCPLFKLIVVLVAVVVMPVALGLLT
jgi:hypothetical protein